jgi:hypothetical protein
MAWAFLVSMFLLPFQSSPKKGEAFPLHQGYAVIHFYFCYL